MKIREKIKKVSVLCLVFLLSINSFAAIVSDNDGSAFVTKAEFDALKNSFNKQIDNYNTSIDEKIDGAIAAYLSGINISKRIDIEPYVSNYNSIRWQTGPYWYVTRRKWNALADTSATAHTDSTGWQIFEFKNFRNHNDAYWFSYDAGRGIYAASLLSFRLWMETRYSDFCNNYGNSGVCAPFFDLKTLSDESVGWSSECGFSVERATFDRLTPVTHGQNGIDNSNWIYTTAIGTLVLATEALGTGDILAYRITGLKNRSGGDMTWVSHISSEEVRFPYSTIQDASYLYSPFISQLWNSGTGNGKVAPLDGISNLPYDYRWNTEAQYKSDMENTKFMMLGTDVVNQVNYGVDKITDQNGTFYDLSDSGNVTNDINVTMTNGKFSRITGWNANNNTNPITGEIAAILKIPLWYRQSWNTIHNGNFIYNKKGNTLALGDGMPIIMNSEDSGIVYIDFDFNEYSDAKDVTITPDNKIKTYFKNEKFTDTSGVFYQGNISGSTTVTPLDGTVWTAGTGGTGHVSVSIEVKRGSDIWLRVNPDSMDGVYCTIKNLKVKFVHE